MNLDDYKLNQIDYLSVQVKYRFIKTNPAEITSLKQRYLQQLIAPLDGMWESFVAQADHYAVVCDDTIVGYCAINSELRLLQFCVPADQSRGQIFEQMLIDLKVTGAFVATCELQSMSLCMDHQKSVSVNALMYHFTGTSKNADIVFPQQANFEILEPGQLHIATRFSVEALGEDHEWLNAYFANRIAEKEIFGLWQNNSLIAIGECRPSKTQEPYADLGVIVSKNHRGQGIATAILKRLLKHCRDNSLNAICSTESKNLAAQKAIEKAGFVSHHRILDFSFDQVRDNEAQN